MEATLIILLSAFGLVLALAYMMYRISIYRKKTRELDEMAKGIGTMQTGKGRPDRPTPQVLEHPIIPASDLLIVMHRNGGKRWRDAFAEKAREGRPAMVVTSRAPGKAGAGLPEGVKMVWLDRSIAHGEEDGVLIINPTNLSAVLDEVNAFFKGREGGGILLLDEFDKVLGSNEQNRVVRFLSMVRDSCSRNSFSVLLPLSYRSTPQRLRSQLTEGFTTVVV